MIVLWKYVLLFTLITKIKFDQMTILHVYLKNGFIQLNIFCRRRERLQAVRNLFYNAYCSTVGFKFKEGPDSGLGSLLGNIAEKVGILSVPRTSL